MEGRPWPVALPASSQYLNSPHKATVCRRQAGRSPLLFGGYGGIWEAELRLSMVAGEGMTQMVICGPGVGFGGGCCVLWGGNKSFPPKLRVPEGGLSLGEPTVKSKSR